ncbi:MAG: T9SS type A sorting domain-containing protein [Bacteroidetes bacterium]|nr:T9SS type A sorting domain-containing protein [Bacteroidota bacterium]
MFLKFKKRFLWLHYRTIFFFGVASFILLSWNSVIGQSLDALPPGFNYEVKALQFDSTTNYLYAAGGFTQLFGTSATINKIARWNGSTWDSLGSGVNDNGQIFALNTYNGYLLSGGSFDEIGGISSRGLAKWDGANWTALANAVDNQNNGAVGCLYVTNSNLYVGGWFDTINGIPAQGVARFDGTNWYSYPSFGGSFHYITAIILFNNELYIGGNFNGGVGKADILKFDGVSWISVGGGLSGANTWINDFKIFQNKLFVGGYFQTNNGDPGNNIAIWDGVAWSQPGSGLMPSNVFEMIVFDNKLFAGGQINVANGIPVSFVAIWDGSSWLDFYGNILDNGVTAFATNGNDLYLGGGFQNINNLPHRKVAKYSLLSGLNDSNASCFSIYPTINTGRLTLYDNCGLKIQEIKVFNSLGQLVQCKSNSVEIFQEVDITGLPGGIYLISVSNFKFTHKFRVFKN